MQEEDLPYEEYLAKKLSAGEDAEPSVKPKKKRGVDLIRMSQQIKKNMLKEALSNQYEADQDPAQKSNDVNLINRKMVPLSTHNAPGDKHGQRRRS